MSVHVTAWVLKHSEEKLGRRLVLHVLADHANEDGSGAWPSVDTIAHEARLSRRQTQRCLHELEAAGSIIQTGTSKQGTAEWTVVMGGVKLSPPENGRGDIHDSRGDIHDAEGVTSTTSGVDRMSPEPPLVQPSIEQPPLEPSIEVAQTQVAQPLKSDALPPPLMKVEGRNLALDALAEVTGLSPGEPMYGAAIVALNGQTPKKGEAVMGINELAWQELHEHVREDQLQELRDDPAKWQEMLKAMIEYKASRYRAEMPNVFLTPKALRDWWLRLEKIDLIKGADVMSTEEILNIKFD